MNLEKIDPIRVQEYIQAIYSRRGVFSNYFGQSFEENDVYLQTENTFMLLKPTVYSGFNLSEKSHFNRIYAASNDRRELIEILSSLKGTNILNYPTKNDIQNTEAIIIESGYQPIGVYERYILNIKDLECGEDMSTITFASEQDLEDVYNLYFGWKDFNPYTDWLPTRLELREFIKSKSVIVNKQNEKIVGVVICPIIKTLINLRLIIDLSGSGIKLINAMFEIARQNKIKHCQFWVNSQNEKGVRFYKRLGAIPDGLKDYTYIKNK